jgi:putative hydrolase of the HAD superfamily
VSGREYWRLVGLADEAWLEQVLAVDAEGWARPNPPLAEWLPRLRAAGLRTALLSNVPREVWAVLSGFHESWLRNCDELVLSFEVGVVKPDERIYRVCLDRLGADPAETLFVDDRPDNVSAAAALGLQAFRYSDVETLRRELRSRLDGAVPLPRPSSPRDAGSGRTGAYRFVTTPLRRC